jgi:hypothetical protein
MTHEARARRVDAVFPRLKDTLLDFADWLEAVSESRAARV